MSLKNSQHGLRVEAGHLRWVSNPLRPAGSFLERQHIEEVPEAFHGSPAQAFDDLIQMDVLVTSLYPFAVGRSFASPSHHIIRLPFCGTTPQCSIRVAGLNGEQPGVRNQQRTLVPDFVRTQSSPGHHISQLRSLRHNGRCRTALIQ